MNAQSGKGLPFNNPIGIFDSGIGGLTVANAIRCILPREELIYFGDTAHLPYGDKSPESIRHYAVKISDFLLKKNCKIILIACNTASSVAFRDVKNHIGNKAIVINVIDPVIEYVAGQFSNSKVGVIGTKGTINSRIYIRKLNAINGSITAVSLATPLLAPMIEEGFYNNNISRTIINSYLSKKAFHNVNAVILGCTHYPIIKKEIEEYYGNTVEIIDSAEIVAKYVQQSLSGLNLLRANLKTKHLFYISDFTESFEKSTNQFFRNKIHLTEARIWD